MQLLFLLCFGNMLPTDFPLPQCRNWVDLYERHCHCYTHNKCQVCTKCMNSSQCNELQFLSKWWNCSCQSEAPLFSQLWSLHFCSTDLSLKVMLLFWLNIWPLAFPATTCPTSPAEVWFYWPGLYVRRSMKASHRWKVKEACLLCTVTIQAAIKRVWYAGLGSLLVGQCVCAHNLEGLGVLCLV